MVDNWQNRQSNMSCESCMHYCNYRCRRHAPTMQGFPAVYLSDWCGDHKMDKECMRQQRQPQRAGAIESNAKQCLEKANEKEPYGRSFGFMGEV